MTKCLCGYEDLDDDEQECNCYEQGKKDGIKKILRFLMKDTYNEECFNPPVVYIEPYELTEKGEKDISGFFFSGDFLELIKNTLTSKDIDELEKELIKDSKGSEQE